MKNKICNKCGIEKKINEFSERKHGKDGYRCVCKKCIKIYRINYRNKTKEHRKNQTYKYRLKNYKQIKKQNHGKGNYNTFAKQISYADKVRNVDGFLQVKCTYCGKWYFPTTLNIKNRINALNGKIEHSKGAENRLYCSNKCKQACPIYRKTKYPEGFRKSLSREVQPELRKMVFERDEYTCIKCHKHQDDLSVPLHCHHIEGIQQNPIMSADIDICITVCKNCHKIIHSEKDCGYNDMKCKN